MYVWSCKEVRDLTSAFLDATSVSEGLIFCKKKKKANASRGKGWCQSQSVLVTNTGELIQLRTTLGTN